MADFPTVPLTLSVDNVPVTVRLAAEDDIVDLLSELRSTNPAVSVDDPCVFCDGKELQGHEQVVFSASYFVFTAAPSEQ